jgi:sugar lactone lactonase YvrE
MCSDPDGNLYIADAGHNQIRKVDPSGNVTVFAGTGEPGQKDGPVLEAMFNYPSGICTDGKGTFYVAGFGGQNVRKISAGGIVTTVAGTGEEGYRDGPGDQAQFSSPRGICIDSKGNLYVGDCWNHRIRKITPEGEVSTFAGGGKRGELVVNAWKDGQDTIARFDAPCGMAIDKHDNIYVADANNNCIRKISPDGYVETLAGIGGNRGSADGAYGESVLNCPTELIVADDGRVYFSDTYGNHIRIVSPEKITSTLVNDSDSLKSPRGITLVNKSLFFIEHESKIIRRFTIGN